MLLARCLPVLSQCVVVSSEFYWFLVVLCTICLSRGPHHGLIAQYVNLLSSVGLYWWRYWNSGDCSSDFLFDLLSLQCIHTVLQISQNNIGPGRSFLTFLASFLNKREWKFSHNMFDSKFVRTHQNSLQKCSWLFLFELLPGGEGCLP